MKKIVFLLAAVISVCGLRAQGVIVNADGTHSVQHGGVVVNQDGTHSVIHGSVVVNQDGTHTVIPTHLRGRNRTGSGTLLGDDTPRSITYNRGGSGVTINLNGFPIRLAGKKAFAAADFHRDDLKALKKGYRKLRKELKKKVRQLRRLERHL